MNEFRAGATGKLNNLYGTELVLTVPTFNETGVHGFAVLFTNGISSIKFHPDTEAAFPEEIQLLDPSPQGTGEWLTVSALKWDYSWVSMWDWCNQPIKVPQCGPSKYANDTLLQLGSCPIPIAATPLYTG